MGTWGIETFESDDACELLSRATEILEAELASYVHRVRFEYFMNIEAARAAAVLLTRFADTWRPRSDCTANVVAAAFRKHLAAPYVQLAALYRQAIETDVVNFVSTYESIPTIRVRFVDDSTSGEQVTVLDACRAIGTDTAVWRYASKFGADFSQAWAQCNVPRFFPQLTLATGVSDKVVFQSISSTLLAEVESDRSRSAFRDDMITMLSVFSGHQTSSLKIKEVENRFTEVVRLETEVFSARHRARRQGEPTDSDDPLHSALFRCEELMTIQSSMTAIGQLDPYRVGDFVEKCVRAASTIDFATTLRTTLDAEIQSKFTSE